MIKLTKEGEPAVLKDNKKDWTDKLLQHIANNEKVPKSLESSYNKDDVKEALRRECNGKCMYCESTVNHITFEHIEHIKPKAKTKFPELTFEYSNLGLACPKCNMNKSDTYDTSIPFINPYADQPENHFTAYGAYIWAKSGNDRAKLTELEIELNRPELLEKRGERIKAIKELIDNYNTTPDSPLKNALLKEIKIEISKEKEYSFCLTELTNNLINN